MSSNVGVRAAHEHEPQQLGAYMGTFMLVPWVSKLLGHLDLVLYCGLRWKLALCTLGSLAVWRLFPKSMFQSSAQCTPYARTPVQDGQG